MSFTEIMRSVHGSYDDFVNSMVRWSNRDAGIKDAILEQLRVKPDSNTDDITLVLWKCLEIGEPIEIVDDEDALESSWEQAVI